jgi:hypothetical protein
VLVDPAVWLSLVGKLATARKVDIGTLATSDYFQSNEPDTLYSILLEQPILGTLSRSPPP